MIFAPCESVGVHVNSPVFELILAPEGGLFSRLNATLFNEPSVIFTVNDNVFFSSMVNLPKGLS